MRLTFLKQVFVFISIVGITACSGYSVEGIQRLNNQQFERKLNKKGFVLLDVRTPAEFDSAHIPGAININVLDSAQFQYAIAQQPLNKKYLIYCRSGKRSMAAARKMRSLGFTNIKELEKGFQKWEGVSVEGN